MGEPVSTAVSRKSLHGFREIAADLFRDGNTELIRKSRCHIGFMNDTGNLERSRRADDRNRNEASLGKYHVGADFFQDTPGLCIALQYPKGIRKILQIKIAAEFSRRNPVIGDFIVSDQLLFHSLIGTDIGNLIAELSKRRQKGYVWRYMSGGSAAGKNDSF